MDTCVINSNDIRPLGYRLSDSIRFNNINNLPNDCIARTYYSKIEEMLKEPVKQRVDIEYETLYDIVIQSQYNECPKKSILFHLRLYDWFDWWNAGKLTIENYEDFIDKHIYLLQNVDNVLLLYGGCGKNKNNTSKTELFVETLTSILKKYNSNVFNITSENTDQDLKYIITSEYYVPSLGGFSNLGGALNKNTVYWDLSEKLIGTYKSPQDKNDISKFKDYHTNNTKTKAIVY